MASTCTGDVIDDLLLEASQRYEEFVEKNEEDEDELLIEKYSYMDEDEDFQYDRLLPQDLHVHEVRGSRFGDPITEADILEKIEGAFPKSTRKTTLWSKKTWQEWAEYLSSNVVINN